VFFNQFSAVKLPAKVCVAHGSLRNYETGIATNA